MLKLYLVHDIESVLLEKSRVPSVVGSAIVQAIEQAAPHGRAAQAVGELVRMLSAVS